MIPVNIGVFSQGKAGILGDWRAICREGAEITGYSVGLLTIWVDMTL
jgi:hypothetical protein